MTTSPDAPGLASTRDNEAGNRNLMMSTKTTRADRLAEHTAKMARKAARREDWYQWPTLNGIRIASVIPADTNRRTMKPHEHKREIARRLRQGAKQ